MIVVAVEDFDVDAGAGHAAGELAELSRFGLIEALDQDVVHGEDLDACRFERIARCVAIFKEKVSDSAAIDHPRSAAFDAHAGAAEGVAHIGECAGTIVEEDGEIFHQ